MRKIYIVFALFAANALTSGCVAAAAAGAAGIGVMAMQDRTIGEGIDDTSASTEVKTRLLAADAQRFSQVDVQVQEGNLLLSGAVASEQDKQFAESVAHSVRSVHNVYDEIVVGPRRGLGRNANDELISSQIRARLIASPNVRSVNVSVSTFNGSVYLMGLARTDAELQRAAQIASTTPGVRRVVSFMQVRERGASYAAAPEVAPAPAPEPEPAPVESGAPSLSATHY